MPQITDALPLNGYSLRVQFAGGVAGDIALQSAIRAGLRAIERRRTSLLTET